MHDQQRESSVTLIVFRQYYYIIVLDFMKDKNVNQKKPLPQQCNSQRNSNTHNSIDVSFSIPDWKQKELKSINEQYEKQIYSAVPLSLTDFDSKEEVEFLSPPEKCANQKYAYERRLLHNEDFSILAFILCLEQLLIGDTTTLMQRIEKFKKKLSEMDLCCLSNIPAKMTHYYNNKVIKKILFQYINKGSYNVSLLEVLLRRNSVLKFSLSLVSKSILHRRGLLQSYTQTVPVQLQMRNCGDEFEVSSTIKVKQKYLQTENFFIKLSETIQVFRKQNIIKINVEKKQQQKKVKRSLTPNICASKPVSKKIIKDNRSMRDLPNQKSVEKVKPTPKRSSSVVNFLRRLICS